MNTANHAESAQLHSLLPHRPPMLLLDRVVEVSESSASAIAVMDDKSLFFMPGKGIPAWVGLELMGQTAALIAGLQQQQGQLAPHTGFLLGSRDYSVTQAWFHTQHHYLINCQQDTVLGSSLASFRCSIKQCSKDCCDPDARLVASAVLTVYRQRISEALDEASL